MKASIYSNLCLRLFTLAIVAVLICFVPSTFAQDKKNASFKIIEQKTSAQVGIIVEYFKLDHRAANKLIRRFGPQAANAKELRNILGEMTEKGEAQLIDTGWVRTMSGQRAKTQSVREDIYPTEYDPPEIPINVGGGGTIKTTVKTKDKGSKAEVRLQLPANQAQPITPVIHMTAAMPSAFETRPVGLTLEIDLFISADQKIIDISLSPEIITRLPDEHFTRPGFEKTARGIENISMAAFHSIKIRNQITTFPGNYFLLGLHSPHDDPDKRIIVLLKADIFRAK